jgi:hypothetical protein
MRNAMSQRMVGGIFGFVMALSLIYMACQPKPPANIVNPRQGIDHVQRDLKANTETLQGTTSGIRKSATEGQAKTPDSIKNTLDPYWIDILINAGIQENVVTSLKGQVDDLQRSKAELDALRKHDEAETARANKAEKDATSEMRRTANKMLFFGAIATAIGIGLMFSGFSFGKMVGGLIAVTGGAMTVIALFVSQVAWLLPYFAVGAAVLGAGAMIYLFLKHQKEKAAIAKQKAEAEAAKAKAVQEKEAAQHSLQMVSADKENLQHHNSGLLVENNKLLKDKEWLANARHELTLKMNRLNEENRSLRTSKPERPLMIQRDQQHPEIESKVLSLEQRTALVEKKADHAVKKALNLETRTEAVEKAVEKHGVQATRRLATLEQNVEKKLARVEKASSKTQGYVEGMAAGISRLDLWTARP